MVLEVNSVVAIGSELSKQQKEKILSFNWVATRKLPYPSSAAVPAFETYYKKAKYPIEVPRNNIMLWWKTIESWLNVRVQEPLFQHQTYKINTKDDLYTLYSLYLSELDGLSLAQIFNLKKHKNENYITMLNFNQTTKKGRLADMITLARISKTSIVITNEKNKTDKNIKGVEQIVLSKDFNVNQLEELLISKNICVKREKTIDTETDV